MPQRWISSGPRSFVLSAYIRIISLCSLLCFISGAPPPGTGNIVGVRANMLAAEIAYEKKDFSSSLSYWLTAAGIQKNSYLNPVCYFNAASCSEELNNDSDAATYYEMAANSKEFLLATRAMFNLARVKESLGDNAGAAEVYKNLVEGHPYDTWANLAQSRLIALKADGFIE